MTTNPVFYTGGGPSGNSKCGSSDLRNVLVVRQEMVLSDGTKEATPKSSSINAWIGRAVRTTRPRKR